MAEFHTHNESLSERQINTLHVFTEYLMIASYPAARRDYDAALDIIEQATEALQRLCPPGQQPVPTATVEAKPAPHASYTTATIEQDWQTERQARYVRMLRGDGEEETVRVRPRRRQRPAFDDRDEPYSL